MYVNPIPSPDDVDVSKKFYVGFTYEDYETLESATEGINRLIEENGGKIPQEWVRFGDKPRLKLMAMDGRIY